MPGVLVYPRKYYLKLHHFLICFVFFIQAKFIVNLLVEWKMAYVVLKEKQHCKFCGWFDLEYDENSVLIHESTIKHNCNRILYEYKARKSNFIKNRDGIFVFISAVALESNIKVDKTGNSKVILHVRPLEAGKFYLHISNDLKNDDLLIIGIQLAHPQPQFVMNPHPYVFGEEPKTLPRRSTIEKEISINFVPSDIGQYEMPVMITFHTRSSKKDIIFIRELVVMVEEFPAKHAFAKTPYTDKPLSKAENFLPAINERNDGVFKIPKLLKLVLPKGLDDDVMDMLPKTMTQNERSKVQEVLTTTRNIFDEGLTVNNYMNYFHHLLWWEEIIGKIKIRKYNMHGVTITRKDSVYQLEVPGLAEKRPSLIRGDKVLLQPHANVNVIFSCEIKSIEDSCINIWNMDNMFPGYYKPNALFNVSFIMSRVSVERCHDAVFRVFSSKQQSRVFPERTKTEIPVKPIKKFYNPHIKKNPQQKMAVEHIVSGTSGLAPYIVFGPPGTGKTMTIVEAIIQLVVVNPNNRVLVCTDSNMAADHIALALLNYNAKLCIPNFILRANSKSREWSMLPRELFDVCNGCSAETAFHVTNYQISMHRVVVTTLLHSAKYALPYGMGNRNKLRMSHLFIDEAGQASEPAALVPVCALLAPAGQLVLAGDPQQLGPVCNSRDAAVRGLGTSLLERLYRTYPEMYSNNPNYITTLVNNFRSHFDILHLPNKLFYKNELKALAPEDALSSTSVLGGPGGDRSIVFHAVNSQEQRMGRTPSYFNDKELDMLKRYVKTLIQVHGVSERDIGIIAPYIRQVYKMKAWLNEMCYGSIEVGTVEAFQGKEKRVILVSTVRANCKLLDYDAKYNLGFLVDDKRFNVAVTRAKAKLIIIGNAACLVRDKKWRLYIRCCKKIHCFLGEDNTQMDRDSAVMLEIATTRFERCRLNDIISPSDEDKTKEKSSKSTKTKNKKKQK